MQYLILMIETSEVHGNYDDYVSSLVVPASTEWQEIEDDDQETRLRQAIGFYNNSQKRANKRAVLLTRVSESDEELIMQSYDKYLKKMEDAKAENDRKLAEQKRKRAETERKKKLNQLEKLKRELGED